MKRLTSLILVLVLLISGCGQSLAAQWQEQYDLGMRYLSEGNYQEAILAFTAAIEIDSNRAEAYVGRGDAYVASGETEENLAAAQADYERAIELDPTIPEAWLGLAGVYIRRGDYDQALEILREALEPTGTNQTIADKIAEMESGEDRDSNGTLRRSRSYRNGLLESCSYYDAEGKVTYSEVYNEDGTINNYSTFEYSTDGRKRTEYTYTEDDVLIRFTVDLYQENGQIEREDIYDVDNGDINQIRYHCYNIYEYDHVGQLIRGTRYEDDGRMRYYYLYEYDETGLITQLTQFNADGSIEERSAWEHDAEGNVTKQTIYHSDGTIDVYTYG